jgi:cell division protein ZapA (FtsZ GTPase activity inhibitor)
MPIVTITLNNRNFQLACDDGAQDQLLHLAANLDVKLRTIKSSNSAASFELLLVIAALDLQDQVQNLQKKLGKMDGVGGNEDEKFAETLTTIAEYLENLAKKVGR